MIFTKYQMITMKQGIDIIQDVFDGKNGHYLVIDKAEHYGIRIDWQNDNAGYSIMRPNEKSMFPDYIKIFVEKGKRYYRHDYEPISNDKRISDVGFMPDDLAIMFQNDMNDQGGVLEWMNEGNIFVIMANIGYYDVELPECDGYKIYIKEGHVYQNFNVTTVE